MVSFREYFRETCVFRHCRHVVLFGRLRSLGPIDASGKWLLSLDCQRTCLSCGDYGLGLGLGVCVGLSNTLDCYFFVEALDKVSSLYALPKIPNTDRR